MLAFVIVLQVLVALFLIMVVLLQPGNRGGASAALGGAGSDTAFGARGANTFLSKITFGAAVAFMVTNFLLSYMSSSSGQKSVLDALESSTNAEKTPDATIDSKKEAEPIKADDASAPVKDENASKDSENAVLPKEEQPADDVKGETN